MQRSCDSAVAAAKVETKDALQRLLAAEAKISQVSGALAHEREQVAILSKQLEWALSGA